MAILCHLLRVTLLTTLRNNFMSTKTGLILPGCILEFKPGTPTHQADMEYGANFFISDYGLRRNCELQKCLCYLEYFIVEFQIVLRV
jgi:hypothetical protein